MASRGGGSAPGPPVSQPSPASAWCWRIGENPASSGVSIQIRSTPAAVAAERSTVAVVTVRAPGKLGGMTTRSCWRPRPAACRVRLTP